MVPIPLKLSGPTSIQTKLLTRKEWSRRAIRFSPSGHLQKGNSVSAVHLPASACEGRASQIRSDSAAQAGFVCAKPTGMQNREVAMIPTSRAVGAHYDTSNRTVMK